MTELTKPIKQVINNNDRGFTIFSESWYADTVGRRPECIDEIMFGLYPGDGNEGTYGEMAMRWTKLGIKTVPRLEVFDGSWHVLNSFGDVLFQLGQVDEQNITSKQFADILAHCGFRDLTNRKNPYKQPTE